MGIKDDPTKVMQIQNPMSPEQGVWKSYLPPEQVEAADDVAAASEKDPLGLDQHQAGAKLDSGKVRPSLVLNGFAAALAEVFEVAEGGAQKYTPYGWREVADGETRYNDAKLRHQNAAARGEVYDQATGLRHAAHEAWNALAVLQLHIEADRAHFETENDMSCKHGSCENLPQRHEAEWVAPK